MPIDATCQVETRIELDEFLDAVAPLSSALGDEETLLRLAPKIRQLANNRDFLADRMLAYLAHGSDSRQAAGFDVAFDAYTSHVMLIHLDREREFVVRANIWPSAKDYAYKVNSERVFSYNYPHDHGFSFLTVGYLGPGYVSDYYEVDPDKIVGYPGEQVEMRFIERSQLTQGRSLVYRAHRDVHVQFPPESMSVSLNLFGNGLVASIADQYIFDVQARRIEKVVNPTAIGVLASLALEFGGARARDYVDEIARLHPVDSVRLEAIKGLARTGDQATREGLIRLCETSGSHYLSQYGRRCVEALGVE